MCRVQKLHEKSHHCSIQINHYFTAIALFIVSIYNVTLKVKMKTVFERPLRALNVVTNQLTHSLKQYITQISFTYVNKFCMLKKYGNRFEQLNHNFLLNCFEFVYNFILLRLLIHILSNLTSLEQIERNRGKTSKLYKTN